MESLLIDKTLSFIMTLRVLVSFIAGFSFMVVVSVGLWLGMRQTTISSTTTVKATSGGLITFASAKLFQSTYHYYSLVNKRNSMSNHFQLKFSDCLCVEIFQPVCGADGEAIQYIIVSLTTNHCSGRTYSNSCKAQCARAEVQCEGECPCSS